MMPQLMAEEELTLRGAASHPHMEPADQRSQIRRLLSIIGTNVPVQKATHADLRDIGIKVREH